MQVQIEYVQPFRKRAQRTLHRTGPHKQFAENPPASAPLGKLCLREFGQLQLTASYAHGNAEGMYAPRTMTTTAPRERATNKPVEKLEINIKV